MRFKQLLFGVCLVLIFVGQMLRAQQIPLGSQLAEMRTKAEKGDAAAQFYIGYSYFDAKDYAETVKWWRKASEQNYSKAQFNLALCYEAGQGVTKDEVQAVKWFRSAAEQNFAKAQYNLGLHYGKGQGVSEDVTESLKWFILARAQGDERAAQFVNNVEAGKISMTPEQLAEGRRRANEWRAKHQKP